MYSLTHAFNVFFIHMLCKFVRKNNQPNRKMGTRQKPNGICSRTQCSLLTNNQRGINKGRCSLHLSDWPRLKRMVVPPGYQSGIKDSYQQQGRGVGGKATTPANLLEKSLPLWMQGFLKVLLISWKNQEKLLPLSQQTFSQYSSSAVSSSCSVVSARVLE